MSSKEMDLKFTNEYCPLNKTIDFSNMSDSEIDDLLQRTDWNSGVLIFSCLVTFGVFTNTSFIWTVVGTSSLHSSTYILLASLACTDIITLIANVALHISGHFINLLGFDQTLTSISFMITVVFSFSFISSSGLITLVSFERYLATCHPLKYHILTAPKRTFKLVGIVFLTGVGLSCSQIPFFLYSFTLWCVIWPSRSKYADYPTQMALPKINDSLYIYYSIFHIIYAVSYLIIIIGVCFMYMRILVALKKTDT